MLQHFLSRSLVAKLLWVFVPLVCFAEFIVFGFQAWSFYQEEKAELVERLESIIEVQTSALASPMWEFDTEEITNNIAQLEKLDYFDSIVVYDDGDNVISSLGDFESILDNQKFRLRRTVTHQDADQKIVVGSIVLTVHGRYIQADLIENTKSEFLILAVLILTLVGGVFLTTKLFISTPLRRLEVAIEEMKGEPVEWNSSDELGTVVRAYNDMQERQDVAEAEVKQYQAHLEELVEDRTRDLQRALLTITSSIEYASRIQRSMLPDDDMLKSLFSDYFLIWEPREPVGGDMIWSHPWGEGNIIIVGDCTGHGVPGAFMTLIGASALERAMMDVEEGDVLLLLQTMHRLIKRMLNQHEGEHDTDDGMELGLCYLPKDRHKLHFLGARFNLYCVAGDDLREIRGTKAGVGYRDIPDDQDYMVHEILIAEEEKFYLVSDGYTDQVGGKHRSMFGKRRFKKLIESLSKKPFADQKAGLITDLLDYQGDEERRDDVSVFGFQVFKKRERLLARENYDFRNVLDQHGVIFSYNGIITEAILGGVAKALKTKLTEQVGSIHSRKIFSLFVEQVQNVIRYSAEVELLQKEDGDHELRYGLFVVGEENGKHYVACSNLMTAEDAPRLEANLIEIKAMTRDEVKAAYKKVLKGDTPVGSKGAGVGFLEIARQASEGIEFDFKKINDEHVFFFIKAFL